MSDEHECRHLPAPAWNPNRCPKCGAIEEETVNERLLAAARYYRLQRNITSDVHDAAIEAAKSERAWHEFRCAAAQNPCDHDFDGIPGDDDRYHHSKCSKCGETRKEGWN